MRKASSKVAIAVGLALAATIARGADAAQDPCMNPQPCPSPPNTELVSVDSAEQKPALGGTFPSISASGRFVSFSSPSALVPEDTNGVQDIYVRDRSKGVTTRVSVSSSGNQVASPGNSGLSSISGTGRYVAYQSTGTNLVPGDLNGKRDVFVTDRDVDQDNVFDEPGAISTVRASVASDGSEGKDASGTPAISTNGRYVAFVSKAALVDEDGNEQDDVYVRDLQTQTTLLVSVDMQGSAGNGESGEPSISSDGRYVAFESESTDLVPGDANGWQDAFVRDMVGGTTTMVSVGPNGQGNGSSGHPSISGDGKRIAFTSISTNFIAQPVVQYNVFVRDTAAATTMLASRTLTGGPTTAGSISPRISGNGLWVAFVSWSSKLVCVDANDSSDVFTRYLGSNSVRRVSVSKQGWEGNADSGIYGMAVAANSPYVAFESQASNLAPPDNDNQSDVFVRYLGTGQSTTPSKAQRSKRTPPDPNGNEGCGK